MEQHTHHDEIESLKREIAALQRENAILREAIDQLPDGVSVIDSTWTTLIANKAAQSIFQHAEQPKEGGDRPSDWSARFGLFLPDMETPVPLDEQPAVQAMAGKNVDGFEMFVRQGEGKEGMWIISDARPLRDAEGKVYATVTVLRDVTARKKLERDLSARTEALVASQAENEDLIARLKTAIAELSTPILEVWDSVLALPVIGVVDSQRGADMTERLLDELSRSRARFVLIDLTGVETLDTHTAAHFIKLARAATLLGATCILTGISPTVAQTLVYIGVDLSTLITLRNLKHGLKYCISALRRDRARDKSQPSPGQGETGIQKSSSSA